MASEGQEDKDIIDACKQIIENCSLETLNVSKLAVFDLEYIFLKLRAMSVNNICKLSFEDSEDSKTYDFDVDLNTVEITKNPEHRTIIDVTDEIKIKMRYPTVDISDKIKGLESEVAILDQLMINSVESIYDKETVYEDYSEKELVDFLDNLDGKVYAKIRNFFETMPKLYYKIEYTNSLGTKREIELRTLKDFFTWG